MITEDYVSRETYKLLKEKGYDGEFKTCYDIEGYTYTAIHLYDAMKWLRETHGIEVIVDVCKVGEDHRTMYAWTPVVVKEDWLEYPVSQTDGTVFGGLCDGYGQAVEKGIEYCLENLV